MSKLESYYATIIGKFYADTACSIILTLLALFYHNYCTISCTFFCLRFTNFASWYTVTIWTAYLQCRSVSKVHDEWFADEDKVRKSVGLLEKPVVKFPDGKEVNLQNVFYRLLLYVCSCAYNCFLQILLWQMTCGICFETYPSDMLYAAACGHPFCDSCWAGLFYAISLCCNDRFDFNSLLWLQVIDQDASILIFYFTCDLELFHELLVSLCF